MNYEEKYKQALGWMRSLYKGLHGATKEDAEHYFPELAESEDERIRKELITHCRNTRCVTEEGAERIAKWIAWLEKQDKQNQTWKPSAAQLIVIKDLIEDENTSKVNKVILRGMFDEFKQFTNTHKREIDDAYLQGICDAKHETEKQGEQTQFDYEHAYITQKDFAPIEPKFKVGDWIVDDKTPNDVFCVIEVLGEIYKVIDIDGDDYHIPHCQADKQFHLWTIQDAKDGDVLVAKDGHPFIFTGEFDAQDDNPTAYCGINSNDKFITGKGSHWTFKDGIKPATKEQRDLLFEKMKEAGYEWDADKKELKKIEPKMLDADKVIAWLVGNIIDFEYYVKRFKQDFGL